MIETECLTLSYCLMDSFLFSIGIWIWLRHTLRKRAKIGATRVSTTVAQFVVDIVNTSDEYTILEIDIFYVNSQVSSQQLKLAATNIGPHQTIGFQLGPCAGMKGYVVVGYDLDEDDNPVQVFRLPDAGYMTAQQAMQMDPAENGPCDDHWEVDISTVGE